MSLSIRYFVHLHFINDTRNVSNQLVFSTSKAPSIFELFDEWRGNDNILQEKIGTSELQIGYSSPNWGQVSVGGFYST